MYIYKTPHFYINFNKNVVHDVQVIHVFGSVTMSKKIFMYSTTTENSVQRVHRVQNIINKIFSFYKKFSNKIKIKNNKNIFSLNVSYTINSLLFLIRGIK